MTLGMVLLKGPRRVVFIMSEVPLYARSCSSWYIESDHEMLGVVWATSCNHRKRLLPPPSKP